MSYCFTKASQICYNLRMSELCKLCPLECGADREQRAGACGASNRCKVAKYGLHPFEEPCISCQNGSGTIFFSGCALRCAFCQNFELSRAKTGKEISARELADIFAELEEAGAENINLVTASQFVPQLAEAFSIYRPKIPIVYNTHAYEKVEALRIIDPFIDIYLPDLKFFSPRVSQRYTGKSDYFFYASRAIEFMVQKPVTFEKEKMLSGCIVRHLILPLNTSDSINCIRWFSSLHSSAYFSLMGQYTPYGEIRNFPELARRITPREYRKVRDFLFETNLENIFLQELSSADEKFIPDFSDNMKTLF